MRLHAARGLEQLFAHVCGQLTRLATQPPEAAASENNGYDAHAVKRVVQKASALLRKSEDTSAMRLGLRLVDACIRSAGPALLTPQPACTAILVHMKQDVCLHLLTALSK